MSFINRRFGGLVKSTYGIFYRYPCGGSSKLLKISPVSAYTARFIYGTRWNQHLKKVKGRQTNNHKRWISTFISDDCKNGIIEWDDGGSSKFHSLWLISNCQCYSCIEKSSNCRRFLLEAPLDVSIKEFNVLENGDVRVLWNHCEHQGYFTADFLKRHCYSEYSRRKQRDNIKPSFSTDLSIPNFAWPEVKESDRILYRVLRQVNEQGIVLLTDVPPEKGYMRNVIQKFGSTITTMYGEVYDVITRKKATNIAYTSENLVYHSDLHYYENAPGLQFFHCLRLDDNIIGGGTLFIDMFHVLQEYRNEFPAEFRVLCEVPTAHQRLHHDREDPVHMIHRKPMVNVNQFGDVIGFAYNPTSMAPALVTEENVEIFYRAYHLLYKKIENFPHVRIVRYKAGDLVCINNRRFVHGRGKFDVKTGVRHLQGAYTNIDDFKSKLTVLSQKYDGDKPVKRVGNNDWM